MSIPKLTSFNQSDPLPLVNPAISLINIFLEDRAPRAIGIRLPRGQGSTTICHQAAQFSKAFIVVQNENFVQSFKEEHKKLFEDLRDNNPQHVYSIFGLKSTRQMSLFDPDLDTLQKISASLRSTDVIFFDAFAFYSANSIIKSLTDSCHQTHKFVTLW